MPHWDSNAYDINLNQLRERVKKEFLEIPLKYLDQDINSEDTIGEWIEFRKRNFVIGMEGRNRLIKKAEVNLENCVLDINLIPQAKGLFENKRQNDFSKDYRKVNKELMEIYKKNS